MTKMMYFAGINNGPDGTIQVEPTSYDYDAPISEAGDLTEVYFAMKNVIGKYLPIPNMSVQKTVPKGDYGKVTMNHVTDAFFLRNTPLLHRMNISDYPKTFEQLDQENGFVLYEHVINNNYRDPSLLQVTGKFGNTCYSKSPVKAPLIIFMHIMFTCKP